MKQTVKYTALALAAIGSLLSSAHAGQTVDLANPAITSGVINDAIYAVDTTHPPAPASSPVGPTGSSRPFR